MVNLQFGLKSFAASNRFLLKDGLALSIFTSTLTSLPLTADENYRHSLMLSPPCYLADHHVSKNSWIHTEKLHIRGLY